MVGRGGDPDVTDRTAILMDLAGRVDPVELRSLDAIHLASAFDLGDELEAMLTDDDRLAEVANGITVVTPG